jgi:hypothetical protein
MNHKLIVKDDLKWKMTLNVLFYPIVVCKGVLTMRWKTAKNVNKEDEMKI